MPSEDIAAIDQRIQRLKNQKAAVLARDAETERRRHSRRKIIAGAWLLKHRPDLVALVRSSLTREQDLAMFEVVDTQTNGSVVDIPLPLPDSLGDSRA